MSPHIGLLNYADVRNFGDVLFPLVVTAELRQRLPQCRIEYITPTGSAWAGMQSTRFDAAELDRMDALILGGGEVVHRLDDMLSGIYGRLGLDAIACPTDLVFGWTGARAAFKAWLALGVPALPPQQQGDIGSACAALQLVGARGSLSRQRLLDGGAPAQRLRLSPDLGWLFPRLLQGRRPPRSPTGGQPYIAVHALGFLDPQAIVAGLARFADATGLQVLLLPLTRCWQDAVPLARLRDLSGGRFMLADDAMDDLDKLALLGQAVLQVGQSMHGFIAAMGQNRPAGLVMPVADDKFTELLDGMGLPQLRCNGWDDLDGLLQTLLATPPAVMAQVRAQNLSALAALFDEVCAGIVAGLPADTGPLPL